MDALGIVLIGVGAFMVFEAVKNKNPMPVTKAKSVLSSANTSANTKPTITKG